MNICDTLYKINSSYSPEATQTILKNELEKYGINEFKLDSNLISVTSSQNTLYKHKHSFLNDKYQITIEYNDSYNSLTKLELEYILSSFYASIERSYYYNNLLSSLYQKKSENFKDTPSLIKDISKEIEVYKRYGHNFCLIRVGLCYNKQSLKNIAQISNYINIIKDNTRSTDSVYCDKDCIYVLLRKISFNAAKKIHSKLTSVLPDCLIGLAEWKDSFVIADLIGETENYIYQNILNNTKQVPLVDELDKILNKAIMYNKSISVVYSKECSDFHDAFKVYMFDYNGRQYSVLCNCTDTSGFSFVYIFNFEDVAEDVLNQLN